jgi:uncharacterized protein GlcG (DUF336 family)
MERKMEKTQLTKVIERIIEEADKLLPAYLAEPEDRRISDGNVSLCIVDPNGRVYGKMWGDDKAKRRNTYQTAWRKASQVWLTGVATGKFEELVYTRKTDPYKFGIMHPDLIGWEGGWPVSIGGGIHLAVAVSGMRGEKDTDLVLKTIAASGGAIEEV